MKTLGICGTGSLELARRLADELDGTTAIVRHTESNEDTTVRPATTVVDHGPGHSAFRSTRERSLDELLDSLAAAHSYSLVVDHPEARIPTIALAGADPAGEPLLADSEGPVSDAAIRTQIEALEPRETLDSLVARVKRSPNARYAGAIATFTGRVRGKEAPNDPETQQLKFEKYEPVASERMAEIEAALCSREGIHEVLLHHRTGVVPNGEDIVFVVVLAAHRTEAFETVSDGIDRLKSEVPLFKKELTTEDEFWVHERE
jgi:molybdopterin synthase catalytic subunit